MDINEFSLRIESENIKVIKRDRTYVTVRSIWENSPDVVSDEKIEELYIELKQMTNVDAAVKKAHIENIEKNYRSSEKVISMDEENFAIIKGICFFRMLCVFVMKAA